MSTRYKEWLKIAEEDLQTAKKLIEGEQQIPRTAIYHT
jgi:HEPN domain-containing protein